MASLLSKGAYRRARHLDLLSNALVDLAMGDITRLMVLMPPRHGKSETCSNWFPSWLLALWPRTKIMLATYSHSLARDNSEKVRNTMLEHSPTLGIYLAKGSKAAAHWKTAARGEMIATGVRGGLTGRGANYLIIDDAVKDAAEAASELIQARNWSWYQSTFRSRLHPNGRILAIGTRWNENDLLGMLLQAFRKGPDTPGYEPWTIICLPAECETEDDLLGRSPARDPNSTDLELSIGDPLWPEGGPDGSFGREWIRSTKIASGSYWWAAVYQQRPAPLEGGIIKKGWLQRYTDDELPDQMDEIATSWDMTFKKTGSSFVVGQVWGRCGGRFYLLAQERGKWDFVETLEAVRRVAKAWPDARAHYVEAAANGEAVIASLHDEIPGIIPVKPEGGKDSRLYAVSPTIESKCVYLPDLPWAEENVYEALSFPNAANNDTVDAMSQALTQMKLYKSPNPEVTTEAVVTREKPLDSYGYNVEDDTGEDDDDQSSPRGRRRHRYGYDAR